MIRVGHEDAGNVPVCRQFRERGGGQRDGIDEKEAFGGLNRAGKEIGFDVRVVGLPEPEAIGQRREVGCFNHSK